MAAEEAMNEQSNDDLKDLRRRLRKLRRKQDKKPKLRKLQYHTSRPEGDSKEFEKETAASSSDFVTAKEWVLRREKKREERHRRSKKKSSRHRHGDEASRKTHSTHSHRHLDGRPSKHSTHSSRSHKHVSGRNMEESERRSSHRRSSRKSEDASHKQKRASFRSVDEAEDRPKKPLRESRRNRQTVDESEEHSLKPSKRRIDKHHRKSSSHKRSSNKSSSHKRSSHKKQSEADGERKSMKKSSERRRKEESSHDQPKKRMNHISVDFSDVPSLSGHGRRLSGDQSIERQASLLGDDSLYRDDASLSTIDTYWGERYFELQSMYTAEEAIEMLREEKEMMKELEEEKRELQRDMEEAKAQRELLKRSLSKKNVANDNLKRIEKNPYAHDDDDASQSTWDDRSVSTFASSVVSSIFPRRSPKSEAGSTTGRSITSGISHSMKKWFPDLQNEVGTDVEREQLKVRRNLMEAKKQRDRLSKKLAKRTAENEKLLEKLEKMDNVSYDDESTLNDCDQSQSTWDDKSVSTMGSRSFVSAIFHPRVVGDGRSLLSGRS